MTSVLDLDVAPTTGESPANGCLVPELPVSPSQPPSGTNSAVAALFGDSPREGDEDYRALVVTLNDRWRIIACRDGIQWILQRRVASHRWSGQIFCRTKAGLLLYVKERCGELRPASAAMLNALPEHI